VSITLDATTKSLQAASDATATTTEPVFYACYVDDTVNASTPGENHGSLTGTSDAMLAAAPAANTQRELKFITITNVDTVSHLIVVKLDQSGTDTTIHRVTLQPNEIMQYTASSGFDAFDSSGFPKQNLGIGLSALAARGGTIIAGQASMANSNTVTIGIAGSNVTMQSSTPQPSLWLNLPRGMTSHSVVAPFVGNLLFFPLKPFGGRIFDGNMTVSSLYMLISGSQTDTTVSSAQASMTWKWGLWSIVQSDYLQLVNSGSVSMTFESGSDATSGLHGPRWIHFPSSAFSTALTLDQREWVLGLQWFGTSGVLKRLSYIAWRQDGSSQHSGFMGTSQVTAASQGRMPWLGPYTVGVPANLPALLHRADIQHGGFAQDGLVPIIAFNNFGSQL
jgi:hypothetical protein